MKKRQGGFTLIELVVVITIIAILSAVALPRFMDAQRDARVAKASAIFGSIRSASTLAKARCEMDIAGLGASPTCTATGGSVNMDGATITMFNRYPTADAAGVEAAAQVNTASDGLIAAGGGAGAGATRTYDMVGAPTPASCRISYTAAAVGAAPVVTLTTTGC